MTPPKTPSREALRLVRVLDVAGIGCVIDVGANVGQYGERLRRAGYGGRIVSIEPASAPRSSLLQATDADPEWTVVEQMALGAVPGKAVLNISAESDMTSFLDLTGPMQDLLDSSRMVATETVPVDRLDARLDEWAERGEKVHLKIDTQGFENQVLDGATGCMDRIASLQLELSMVPIYEGEPLWRPMVDRIEAMGFEPVLLIPGYFNNRTGRMLQFDGVFVRPS